MAVSCRICRNDRGNISHVFYEMMYGSRDEFPYTECSKCGCLQIEEIPAEMGRYYGSGYYSFGNTPKLSDNSLKAFAKRLRLAAGLKGNWFLPRLYLRIYHPPDYFTWFQKTAVGADAEILDVGCGIGNLLIRMRKDGFTRLTGIDPHIKEDIHYANGVEIFKKDLLEIDRCFDFIMLHHSFEHMAEPLDMLNKLYELLHDNSFLLIRVPVAGTFAWREYGTDWVQIDAPRHLFLHTVKSMEILAAAAGFEVRDVVFDSTGFQIWGSEQNKAGIPLRDSRSHAQNKQQSLFTEEQILDFDRRADSLNREQDGDQACFYLYKV